MNEPKYDRIAGTFVTADRHAAAFYLRMKEENRPKTRLAVVNDSRGIVRRHGFRPFLVGGVYELQGVLARLVESSLVKGLGWLIAFFTGIAWIIARNVRSAAAMIFSISLVPLYTLGGIGLLHVRSISFGSGHEYLYRHGDRFHGSSDVFSTTRTAGRETRLGHLDRRAREQWRGIVFSDVIIAAGFALHRVRDWHSRHECFAMLSINVSSQSTCFCSRSLRHASPRNTRVRDSFRPWLPCRGKGDTNL
jgi:uncharacterized protein